MNILKALQYAAILAPLVEVLETVKKNPTIKYKTGDALLYIACRLLAKQLETRNPGIWGNSGFVTPIESGYGSVEIPGFQND